jgi:RNA polymerase sigma-70 factor (ECF subfamily)
MADPREQALLNRVKRGDRAAFDALCRHLEQPLFGYALGLVQDRTEAEDIAQEALFRLYRMARGGEIRSRRGSARALVFTIAHNLAMDVHRRARNVVPLDARQAELPSARAERALLREQIDAALGTVSESQRCALLLREFGGLTYAEIAGTLDASTDAVRTWIYRARQRLAQLLDRDGQYVAGLREPNQGEQSHDM